MEEFGRRSVETAKFRSMRRHDGQEEGRRMKGVGMIMLKRLSEKKNDAICTRWWFATKNTFD